MEDSNMKNQPKEATQAGAVGVGDVYDYRVGKTKKIKNSMLKDLKVDNSFGKGKK